MSLIAEIGPLTGILESMTRAIGAGIVLGTFTLGTLGLLAGRTRQMLETRVLTDGYAGGCVGLGAVIFDSMPW